MTTTTLKVQGMTCNHCVMRVQKALKGTAGVQDARVDLKAAEAAVTYDETKVDGDKLAAVIADAGYKVAK